MRALDNLSDVDDNVHVVSHSSTAHPVEDLVIVVGVDGLTIVSSNLSNNHELGGQVPVGLLTEVRASSSILREHDDVCSRLSRLRHEGQVSVNVLCQDLVLETVMTVSGSDCHLSCSLETTAIHRPVLHHSSSVVPRPLRHLHHQPDQAQHGQTLHIVN